MPQIFCPGVSAKEPTPHRWKRLLEAEVAARRHEIPRKLTGVA